MKTLPIRMETVDAESGKIVKSETVAAGILPPRKGCCSVCGVAHQPEEPHNAQSMYYQYAFYGEHGRWPTWADAVAHCAADVQALWRRELIRMKAWSEPDGSEPVAQPYATQQGAT